MRSGQHPGAPDPVHGEEKCRQLREKWSRRDIISPRRHGGTEKTDCYNTRGGKQSFGSSSSGSSSATAPALLPGRCLRGAGTGGSSTESIGSPGCSVWKSDMKSRQSKNKAASANNNGNMPSPCLRGEEALSMRTANPQSPWDRTAADLRPFPPPRRSAPASPIRGKWRLRHHPWPCHPAW